MAVLLALLIALAGWASPNGINVAGLVSANDVSGGGPLIRGSGPVVNDGNGGGPPMRGGAPGTPVTNDTNGGGPPTRGSGLGDFSSGGPPG